MKTLILVLGLISGLAVRYTFAQPGTLRGKIVSEDSTPIEGAHIIVDKKVVTISSRSGEFSLIIEINKTLKISHISYDTLSYTIGMNDFDNAKTFTLQSSSRLLKEITISDQLENRNEAGLFKLKPIGIQSFPSPFGDFTSALTTLPGVASNNELSSTYRVRGGNFDENLVYVEDIPVYRPQLISSGEQEGLSFVNTDLAENVSFSSGGWEPLYGDKLSSVLRVNYREPEKFFAKLNGGLLGGSLSIGAANKKKTISFLTGVRHKDARYLFNTFDTRGEYLPRFTDLQGLLTIKPIRGKDQVKILFNTATNRYEVIPTTRETEFGSFGGGVLRFLVGFDGRDLVRYTTYQGGVKWDHQISSTFINQLILSAVKSGEREFSNLESGYRLCDVNTNIGSANFNECVTIRGLGTQFDYARNRLDVGIFKIENRQTIELNPTSEVEWGLSYSYTNFDNELNEYEFIDSADYVNITERLYSKSDLKTHGLEAFVQNRKSFSLVHSITYGARVNFQDVNNNMIFSPRFQYSLHPQWDRDVIFRLAAGIYGQQPFFRERLDFSGNINENIKPQYSFHIIAGTDYSFQIWARPFKFIGELYYKYLWNIIPYDIDNVRIRYYGDNLGNAMAEGIDLRISGEFIPGTESWFSLGLLNTKEDVSGDGKGYIRRPSDQHINLGIVFQDHVPGDPTLKVYISLLFGSGFPFSPPDDYLNRNSFKGEQYRRVDLALSKEFNIRGSLLQQIKIRAEILNLLGVSNTISYNWIEDYSGRKFGVPNTLSTRFFNLKLEVDLSR